VTQQGSQDVFEKYPDSGRPGGDGLKKLPGEVRKEEQGKGGQRELGAFQKSEPKLIQIVSWRNGVRSAHGGNWTQGLQESDKRSRGNSACRGNGVHSQAHREKGDHTTPTICPNERNQKEWGPGFQAFRTNQRGSLIIQYQ